MQFPELHDWQATSRALHQASMLLGPIHNAVFAPRRNYLHLPMFIEPQGLVSQTLPQGGKIHINFRAATVDYQRAGGEMVSFPLADHTQGSLFAALLDALRPDELANFFAEVPGADLVVGLMNQLHADPGRVEFLHLADVTHTDPLIVNPATAAAYAGVLDTVFTATARFRARLNGHMTPIVVWPEHFDLSTLWFHPGNAAMDDQQAHMNFGFTPYTPGQYDEPYLYAYVYPYPESFNPPRLPEPAFWHLEGWRGVVVKYDDLRRQADPQAFIEALWAEVFPLLFGLIDR